jgi:hypothetical protein
MMMGVDLFRDDLRRCEQNPGDELASRPHSRPRENHIAWRVSFVYHLGEMLLRRPV